MPPTPVPWATERSRLTLDEHRRAFMRHVGRGPWSMVWCAGAGVTNAEDRAWGDRTGVVTDPDGYRWVLATFKRLVPFSE